jgi:hypothetical protein
MAHSLIGADRSTHLKILAVALVAGVVFVMVGKSTIFTTGYDVNIR